MDRGPELLQALEEATDLLKSTTVLTQREEITSHNKGTLKVKLKSGRQTRTATDAAEGPDKASEEMDRAKRTHPEARRARREE